MNLTDEQLADAIGDALAAMELAGEQHTGKYRRLAEQLDQLYKRIA